MRNALDLIFPFTLTRHLGDSLLLSPTPISNGLSMSSESSLSTHLDINLVSSMLGSAGFFGETKVSFTRIWSLNCVSRHPLDISNLSNGHVKIRLSGQYWIYIHSVRKLVMFSLLSSCLIHCSNFSKPAAPVIAQMFNFLNLGFEGYKRIAAKDLRNARVLSRALDSTYFKVWDHPPLIVNRGA